MPKYNKFDSNSLNQISRILGEFLTGSKITDFFNKFGYNENSNNTKRIRIYTFFVYLQNRYDCSNKVIDFIQNVVNPINYLNDQYEFLKLINELNKVLSFSGLNINEEGKFIKINKATNINEAISKATNLRKILHDRNIHPDVLKFCVPELIQENYFHAVLEATKSIADKLRNISGLSLDGNQLVYKVFDKNKPLIAINTLQTSAELNEQDGLKSLISGVFTMFRNPHAHEPKIYWNISEQDTIDLFTTLSFIHRRLDIAVKIPDYK
ncbi:TIGR02391 family protein [Clostridium perfringens]|uniref:TIGR02391 family protein n=1 Tax=Clostridium perfringens TaxID=1502 RepID=UPI0024BD5C5A|nr:TIGR02391 family protein [Clostridium perfringens]